MFVAGPKSDQPVPAVVGCRKRRQDRSRRRLMSTRISAAVTDGFGGLAARAGVCASVRLLASHRAGYYGRRVVDRTDAQRGRPVQGAIIR